MVTRFAASFIQGLPESSAGVVRKNECSGKAIAFLMLLAMLLWQTPAGACTTAIVSAEASATGRPMIWKQRDADDEHNIIAHVQGVRYAFTALFPTSDIQHRKAYAGINMAGFAIANNLSYNFGDTGARNGELMCRALGECGDIDDFVALLDSWEQPRGVTANFAVLDAKGGAAYFEVSNTDYTRYDVPKGSYLYRTNFSFSGTEGDGGGYVRFQTIEARMRKHGSRKFDAGFFLNEGRSFVNVLDGGDAIGGRRSGVFNEHDFIARDASVASIVIEGVASGEDAASGMMWAAIGWTPSCYAIPVWVAAGDHIAEPLLGEANLLSLELKQSVRAYPWNGGEKYLKIKPLRSILKSVRRAEKIEIAEGLSLDVRLRSNGFDMVAVDAYNTAATLRFNEYRIETKKRL